MANKIILHEDEYQIIAKELSDMHSEQLSAIRRVISELKFLVTRSDFFSVEHTSKMIEDVLNSLSSDAISLLEQTFQDSEAGIAHMIQSVIATDTIKK